jgi:hypothetical protein
VAITALIDRSQHMAVYGVGGNRLGLNQIRSIPRLCSSAPVHGGNHRLFLLETMSWTPVDGIFFIRHIDRLLASADYFNFQVSRKRWLASDLTAPV